MSAPGLYLHVPFCTHVCGYCDFNTYAGLEDEIPRYLEALRADLRRVAAMGPGAVGSLDGVSDRAEDLARDWRTFGSIFVGGGTPTLLPPDDFADLLRLARQALPFAEDAEVTTEANPEDVTAAYLAPLVDAGLTRISIGSQSASVRVLQFLDRRHDPDTPARAIAAAREAGVAVVNVDLIYGAPAERAADWEETLDAAVAAGTDHVSAYALTLEPNTGYASRVRAGEQPPPDDDAAAERMAIAEERLGAAGLERYEISNWARPGARCRHNLNYWRGGDYLGVGAGAHGHWRGRRWWSHRGVGRYTDAALAGRSTTSGAEVLAPPQVRAERLMLGLRAVEGVLRGRVEPVDEHAVARLVAAGLLSDDGEVLRLTAAGRPLANAVTVELLAAG
jgi:putative oxygen-independent coproporphyrinogen III oxidase